MNQLINLNYITKEFAEKIYNNDDELILMQLFSAISKLDKETYQEFTDNLNNHNMEFNILKLFKAMMGYCGKNNIDLNKYFKLSI